MLLYTITTTYTYTPILKEEISLILHQILEDYVEKIQCLQYDWAGNDKGIAIYHIVWVIQIERVERFKPVTLS